MTAEIISVGTELLMGQIVNTDAQYLAQQLSALGINLYHQSTVGDNLDRLVDAIRCAMSRADILILSGGLGPTADDLTKWGVAAYLGVDMVEDETSKRELEALFERRHYTLSPNNYRQVQFPRGTSILPNAVGTAPGCISERNGKAIIVLPGPPSELKEMFRRSVFPYLEQKCDRVLSSRMLRIFGIGESMVEHQLRDLIEAQTNPTIAPYADFVGVKLRVTARTKIGEDPNPLLQPVIDAIVERLGDAVYSTDDESLPQVCAKLLQASGATIAIAESLTGGAIASEFTEIPGISDRFREGIVCYSDEAKCRLGVPQATLDAHTAVSEETAIAMARVVRERAGTIWGVATTGVAGPGPNAIGQPEGLYFIAVSGPGGDTCQRFDSGAGGRARTRRSATLAAFDMLRKRLSAS